jgi:hypothetical protein
LERDTATIFFFCETVNIAGCRGIRNGEIAGRRTEDKHFTGANLSFFIVALNIVIPVN